jgi:L-lactate dehydrogenase complex protein LldG
MGGQGQKMTAKDEILGRIRASLGRGALGEGAAGALAAQLADPAPNLIPKRAAALGPAEREALFIGMAEEVQTTVARVPDAAAVPAAVAAYLAERNLPAQLVAAPDPQLDDIPWGAQALLELRRGMAEDGDLVGVTGAFAGIAETGTLMLISGAASPTRNNFLPDTHIVVLRAGQLVGTYEDGWRRLREAHRGAMPRTVNFVTGPSRTGDIEQRIELGAHGPRRLHIILVDAPEGTAG